MTGEELFVFAALIRNMVAGWKPPTTADIADVRVEYATSLREQFGFDAVAAYDLADRRTAATAAFADAMAVLGTAAADLIKVTEEVAEKAERIERGKQR